MKAAVFSAALLIMAVFSSANASEKCAGGCTLTTMIEVCGRVHCAITNVD